MTQPTQTFPIGRYRRVIAGFQAPVIFDAIPKGAKTRLNMPAYLLASKTTGAPRRR